MKIKKIIRYILGWGLIGFGIIGLFLPFLQGILMILLGIFILEKEKEMAFLKKYKVWLKNRLKFKKK